ncbi:MAG: hypothetical protein RML36_08895 [Anaerolineae bacterium]|nr:hypothetical protein [Anaerolineae bacterium]MDW8099581.1 hypothetical protein [Anaerolineae bacterium]
MRRREQIDWRVENGPLIGMRLWLSSSPWRLGAAWAAIAGALASGRLTWQGADWIRLCLLIFLTDPLWGGLWAVWVERQRGAEEVQDLHQGAAPAMPYLRPGSPAARLLGWMERDQALVTAWRLGLPALLTTILTSLILGQQALFATGMALILCFIGWTTRQLNGLPNLWAQALVTIGLPWVLGHVAYAPLGAVAGGLALAFVLWQRAALGIQSGEKYAWWLLGLAQAAAAIVLVIARHPLGAASLTLMALPVWWMRMGQAMEPSTALARSQMWWWLALLLSGWALGSSL